jgi:hypothetical protein
MVYPTERLSRNQNHRRQDRRRYEGLYLAAAMDVTWIVFPLWSSVPFTVTFLAANGAAPF